MKTSIYTFILSFFILISCAKDTFYNDSNIEAISSKLNFEEVTDLEDHTRTRNRGPIKVFRAPKPITIDGQERDWKRAPHNRLRMEIDLGFDLENKRDLVSYFRLLWDDENLYLFAKIVDEDINVSAQEVFDKDGLEVYIDGNNSKEIGDPNSQVFPPAAYGDNTDFFRFIPGQSSPLSAWGIISTDSFESQVILTEYGYNVEVKIPFDAFPKFKAKSGQMFGLELQVNDNDNGERQHLYKWWSDSDFSYLDPSVFGTAVLF